MPIVSGDGSVAEGSCCPCTNWWVQNLLSVHCITWSSILLPAHHQNVSGRCFDCSKTQSRGPGPFGVQTIVMADSDKKFQGCVITIDSVADMGVLTDADADQARVFPIHFAAAAELQEHNSSNSTGWGQQASMSTLSMLFNPISLNYTRRHRVVVRLACNIDETPNSACVRTSSRYLVTCSGLAGCHPD